MLNAWEPLLTGLLALSALGVCVSTVCHVLVWHVVRRRRRYEPSSESVTILRPLCGVDACLVENQQAARARPIVRSTWYWV
jgi:hypothetical protein